MAWQCSARSNAELVVKLRRAAIFTDTSVERAMLAVDRGHYAPEKCFAYEDSPQPIGNRATISAPHMHAHSLQLLAAHLKPGMRALDVGAGSGYLTACMAHMVGPAGCVVGIDYLAPLVQLARKNLKNAGEQGRLDSGQLVLCQGDGWLGVSNLGPYDAIHVGAAAATLPDALLEQMTAGARMVIPVGTHTQYFYQIDKESDGSISQKKVMGVRYIPLVRNAAAL